jgi:Tfp pilus assembly protein PilX
MLQAMRLSALRRRLDACPRLLRDEQGMALVMALGIMMVLTLALGTVMYLTAAGGRNTQRTNAGQKAYALAEAGINNSLAVLNANYPGTVIYPGDSTLLPVRTTTYSGDTATWSGSLVAAPTTASWKWEWHLTSTGSVKNPTGPGTANVTRTVKSVVPVVIPESTSVDPITSSLNWVYASNNLTFGQSVTVASPVYAGNDLELDNTVTISEAANKVVAGHWLILTSPQNQIGRIVSPTTDISEVHVGTACKSKANPAAHLCVWGATDKIYATTHDYVIDPGLISPKPTMTCCAPVAGTIPPAAPAGQPSTMGFWYQNAYLGPNSLCATSSGSPPKFDTASGVPDGSINGSAYPGASPFDLTGATYTCRSADGKGELSYNAATKTLTVNGPIFIDGSVISTAAAKYVGKGAIILSGTFSMGVGQALCVNLSGSGSTCNTAATWDPNTASLFIIADGLVPSTTDGIEIKKAQYQGGLLANHDVYGEPASGTLIQGPAISAYGNVSLGQSGTLSFPAISFPTSGTDGFTGPLPLPQLLPPQQFEGG